MGGTGPPYSIPDWRSYKVEDAPELMKVRERLASHGLSNPWLRNEVWRYNKYYFPAGGEAFCYLFLRGLKYALPAFIATVAIRRSLGLDDVHHHDTNCRK